MAPSAVIHGLLGGERIDLAQLYFRTVMLMTADSDALRDFTLRLFIGMGRREPARLFMLSHQNNGQ